ncbi:hypothetical protein D3C72_919780 [compost metagenome]
MIAVAGEFRVGGIETGVEGADFHAFTGDAGGVGLLGLHPAQAPVAEEFGAAPTAGIAGLAGFEILRLNLCCGNHKQQGTDRNWLDAYVHVHHSLLLFYAGSFAVSPVPLTPALSPRRGT